MHAALFVIAQVVTNTTPAPTQMVLDGCNTASAIRAAEIRLTAPDAPHMNTLLDQILEQKDGAICLMESEVLVNLYRAGSKVRVARALAAGLGATEQHLSTRAAELAMKIRAFDPAGYDELMRRVESKRGAWQAFDAGPNVGLRTVRVAGR